MFSSLKSRVLGYTIQVFISVVNNSAQLIPVHTIIGFPIGNMFQEKFYERLFKTESIKVVPDIFCSHNQLSLFKIQNKTNKQTNNKNKTVVCFREVRYLVNDSQLYIFLI